MRPADQSTTWQKCWSANEERRTGSTTQGRFKRIVSASDWTAAWVDQGWYSEDRSLCSLVLFLFMSSRLSDFSFSSLRFPLLLDSFLLGLPLEAGDTVAELYREVSRDSGGASVMERCL